MKSIIYYILLLVGAFPLLGGGCSSSSDSASPSSGQTGKGGSTARFTVQGSSLLTLSGDHLVAYDASSPSTGLVRTDSINVGNRGWNLAPETIFPFGDYVLIGTPSGMMVYENNQGSLEYISTYNHWVSCDPVVAQGNYAYITLRQETRCNRGMNQMEVIDISDITQPILKGFALMNKPYGLAVNGPDVFVCEPTKLAQVDVSNPAFPQIIRRYDVSGNDCIYDRGRLIVVGRTGLVQYLVEGDRLVELSRIAATRTGG